MKISLYLVHGWGYDHCFWEPMVAYLRTFDVFYAEKGYFDTLSNDGPGDEPGDLAGARTGAKARPRVCDTASARIIRGNALPPAPFLAAGHSAGVLDLLTRNLPGCIGLVGFNGFPRFTTPESSPYGIPRRFLERTQRQLTKNPEAVLRSFRKHWGDFSVPPPSPNIERLNQGLSLLISGDGRAGAAAWSDQFTWFVGQDDPVPPARDGFATGMGATLSGGHLLPQEDPERCADALKKLCPHA